MDAADADDSVIDFRVEAQRTLEEVSFAIKHGTVSTSLPSIRECAYCNLTTSEGAQYTVRLCLNGFQVCTCHKSRFYPKVIVL